MCGTLLTGWFGHLFELSSSDRVLIAVGGMSACLGAVVQAPVTAILIIFEMTHQFSLLPGLMLAGLLSQAVARSIVHANFYEAALLQDGHRMEHIVPPRDLQGWQNLPVSAIAHFDPVVAEGLEPAALREIMNYSFNRFPVVEGGCLTGILTRQNPSRVGSEERAKAWHRLHRASAGAGHSRSPASSDRIGGWDRRCHRSRKWQTTSSCDA